MTKSGVFVQALLKRITLNPEVMVGKPVIKGTRLTVEYILNKILRKHSIHAAGTGDSVGVSFFSVLKMNEQPTKLTLSDDCSNIMLTNCPTVLWLLQRQKYG